MNPNTTTEPAAAGLPPLPPQPNRPSTSCDRHPEEQFTGFCPSCLCERLAVLDPNSSTASSSRKPPTSSSSTAAALKAIFKASSSGGGGPPGNNRNKNSSGGSSFFPELRRTKSFSASKNEGFSGVFEPQRKSCDVRVRNTLWSLFTLDDERNPYKKKDQPSTSSSSAWPAPDVEVDTRHSLLPSSSVPQGPVLFESKEEDEEEEEEEEDDDDDEIRVSQESSIPNVALVEERVQEIVEEEEEEEEEEPDPEPELELDPDPEPEEEPKTEELKTMKDHIDLDSQTKKPSGRDFKEIAGSFWSAASVFSKKLQKWRQKQKLKKRRNGGGSATLPVEKPIGRQFRETQSEIADYGFGRRSCDTDPRFSLDAGRMSFDASRISLDDPRYSFDEPRASWDGYLIGRTFPRMPTMVSVVEDAPVHVLRSDTQIPVEENAINDDETAVPGGSAQTRDYYSDSSSRRRKSLDRSNSIRKTAAAVVAEIDELKSVSNAKVSPATTTGDYYFQGPKLVVPDRESRDSNSNYLRDDCSETFEMGFRDTASVVGNGERKGSSKKSRRWSKAWNIWGLINRRGGNNKDEDEDPRFSRPNGVERSFSESWQELRGERNGDARGAFNRKVFRSNSSVSWRNSNNFGGSFGSVRKNGLEANGHGKKKRDDQFVLERNRSARYSPNNIENGLLRFYLTPMRSSWRSGSGKSRSNHAHSIARSVLRLY
ncbi:protein OCTOPUS [Alnus glutinosa]|uniref:protein OCTOPUS n=1 Tax=Alnus glutinosa TaxID=3517 RepID=UPI002D788C99|nr:protein OCTOPUS [Alnus glutinosa]XP_062166395.1 protein OCTOPUS [Alnus glutinosa]